MDCVRYRKPLVLGDRPQRAPRLYEVILVCAGLTGCHSRWAQYPLGCYKNSDVESAPSQLAVVLANQGKEFLNAICSWRVMVRKAISTYRSVFEDFEGRSLGLSTARISVS